MPNHVKTKIFIHHAESREKRKRFMTKYLTVTLGQAFVFDPFPLIGSRTYLMIGSAAGEHGVYSNCAGIHSDSEIFILQIKLFT